MAVNGKSFQIIMAGLVVIGSLAGLLFAQTTSSLNSLANSNRVEHLAILGDLSEIDADKVSRPELAPIQNQIDDLHTDVKDVLKILIEIKNGD